MLTIENRAGVDVLVMGNGCRPASEAESAFYAEITRLRAEIDLVIAQREAWRVSALTCQRSSAEFAANADRLRADVEALRSLVEVLAQHDSYSTEYDGRMIALCPDCGGQDGTHTTGCVFVRAKAHIDAAPAAPQQAESALNERVGLAYKNGYEEALNDCIRNGGEAWARSMFANGGEHIKPQQAEPVAHLWQCLGLWSVDLVTGGTKAELAPPQYLLDAVAAAIRHPVGKVHSPMGPRTPDPTMVICPACTSQFTATPESVQAEVQRLKQERDGLKNRLESRHDGGPDGISARDETIKMQDAEVRRLQEALEPFTAIDLTTNQAVDAMDVLRARRALEGGE